MRFVFASYVATPGYNKPEDWLERIKAYTGILDALALNNEVISIEQIACEDTVKKNDVTYEFKRFKKGWRYFPLNLSRHIKQLKPDVVLIHSLHFPLQVILLRLVLGRKHKIIIQNHAEKPFTGLKKHAQKLADKFIDAYLFASKQMGLEWVHTGNLSSPGKIYEVMELSSVFYPIDRESAKKKTGVSGHNNYLWVGRVDQNKDPLTVVNAFLKFATDIPGSCLYMIYHTEELLAEIKQLLAMSVNPNCIKLIGMVAHDDLLYWYNSFDFIVSGSHYEGSGTAVCEAMSCGCIPVLTDIFSFRMLTNDGNIGLLYPPGNEDLLLATLHKTPKMDLKAERAKALTYFNSNLSFDAIAKKIKEIAWAL